MDDEKAKNTDVNGLNGQKHSLLMKVLRWSFNDIIHGCAKEKNYMLAWKLMLQMQNLGLKSSSHTYDGIIRAVVSQRSFGDAMRMGSSILADSGTEQLEFIAPSLEQQLPFCLQWVFKCWKYDGEQKL